MGQKVLAVRIGDKYGPEHEEYINSKIPNVEWIHESFDPRVKLQWNKLIGMSYDIDEPLVVIDIDILLLNDYMDLINYPIKPGQFVSMTPWWKESFDLKYKMHGGFQKYYPKDCKYIFNKFMSDPEYWQEYYIKNGTTIGPVNGEQFFVEDSVNEQLTLTYVPQEWIGFWKNHPSRKFVAQTNLMYPGEYYHLGQVHPEVRFVHFLSSHGILQKPDRNNIIPQSQK